MKGRTWCIEFLDSAKTDGNVKVKWKLTDANGAPFERDGNWSGYKAGDSPDKKAKRFFTALNTPPFNQLCGVNRAGNTVCFQLKDSAPYRDINGIEVGDQTGQTFNIYDDVPDDSAIDASKFLDTVRFRIKGVPVTPNSIVRLGVGQIAPMAEVATHKNDKPRELAAIMRDLVSVFNKIYKALGFEAKIEDDEVVIPKVPCTLGTRGGSNDTGLEYWLSMLDPELPLFSRTFDKTRILLESVRVLNARLDLAGIADVVFTDPELSCFAPEGFVFKAAKSNCETAIKITSFPGRITAGTNTLDLKIKYTAQLSGTPPTAVTDPVINIVVERIDNQQQKVVDQKLTSVSVTSPAKDKEITASANSDMSLVLSDGVRITATLVCNECPAISDGPKLASVV